MDKVIKRGALISVVMPAYNASAYIDAAICSILNQTYTNFELIIVDDFSSDETIYKIESYNDSRIVLLKNDRNEGVVFSLNKGISIAKGLIIARMDSDDISIRNRFELQIDQFVNNDCLVLCGSWYKVVYKNKIVRQVNLPVSNLEIKKRMVFHNPFCHPSVMFKKEIWDSNKFNYENIGCEDYGFWLDCSDKGEYYNIPSPLLLYRVHSENISLKSNSLRDSRLLILFKLNIQRYLGYDMYHKKKLSSLDIINIFRCLKDDNIYFDGFIEYLLNYKVFNFKVFYQFGFTMVVRYLKVFLKIKVINFKYRLNIYLVERGCIYN